MAVRHNRRRESSHYYLAVLAEDVQISVNRSDYILMRKAIKFTWIKQGEDHLSYTLGEQCN